MADSGKNRRESGETRRESMSAETRRGSNTPSPNPSPSPSPTPDSPSNDKSVPVHLYVYDLSRGMARAMSMALLGQQLDGIWHTAIIIYGREYFYGVEGILQCPPAGTVLGQPLQDIIIGNTSIPKALFLTHLAELGKGPFAPGTYDLFTHNCNVFSNDVSQFLTGHGIPDWILNLPAAVLNTPLGQILQQFSRTPMLGSSSASSSSSSRGRGGTDTDPVDDLLEPSFLPTPLAPTVFKNIEPSIEVLLDQLQGSLSSTEISASDTECLSDLRSYATGTDGSWILGDELLHLIEEILVNGTKESVIACLKILAWLAVTKADLVRLLHQDNRTGNHIFLKFASNIDQLAPGVQEALATFLCNLFGNTETSDWLMYTSDWNSGKVNGRGAGFQNQNQDNGNGNNKDASALTSTSSNLRVITKVGIYAMLATSPSQNEKIDNCINNKIQEVGLGILYNLLMTEKIGHVTSIRSFLPKSKVFWDEVLIDITLALLQFLSSEPIPEEPLIWQALQALCRCCSLSRTEIPNLIQQIGPTPSSILSGQSERCDQLIQVIEGTFRIPTLS